MITIDFCITFTQLLNRPVRRVSDQHIINVVEKGIRVPEQSILGQSDLHSLYGGINGSPVSIYAKAYAFIMENQDAFIHRQNTN